MEVPHLCDRCPTFDSYLTEKLTYKVKTLIGKFRTQKVIINMICWGMDWIEYAAWQLRPVSLSTFMLSLSHRVIEKYRYLLCSQVMGQKRRTLATTPALGRRVLGHRSAWLWPAFWACWWNFTSQEHQSAFWVRTPPPPKILQSHTLLINSHSNIIIKCNC